MLAMNLDNASILWLYHKRKCYVVVRWEQPGVVHAKDVRPRGHVRTDRLFLRNFSQFILYVMYERIYCYCLGEHEILCGLVPGQIMNPITNHTEEIDECALMPTMCTHGRCLNTPGSFECQCEQGYVYDQDSHQCIDENECLQVRYTRLCLKEYIYLMIIL